MFPCKAFWTNGSYKQIRLPSPENEREFLTEVKKKLRLHDGKNRQASLQTFYAHGFSHITDQNGKVIFGNSQKNQNETPCIVTLLRERREERKTLQEEISRRRTNRPRRFLHHRPVAILLMQAAHARRSRLGLAA